MPSKQGILSMFLALALALVAGAAARDAVAQTPGGEFPRLRVWAFPGAFQDSSLIDPTRCLGSMGPRADSILPRARTVTVRILRDRRGEARADFGGYRLYRVEHRPDTSAMVLLRRFTFNRNSEHTWNLSRLNPNTMEYVCPPVFETPGNPLTPVVGGPVVHDSVITFVDSDSNGSYQKVCRRVDRLGRCLTPGDSVFRLVAPPGPHDGFRIWYAVTYEKRNTTDQDNEDLFVPDTLDGFARCGVPGDRLTCPNLNNRLTNLITIPVEPTGGPTENLETVRVVPNPFRGSEVWEQSGQGELHFINLPSRSTIKIFTSSGDLVRVLEHDDPVRDFARWDLRNADGREVASGIYLYRVDADKFTFQNRFVVIR